MDYRYLVSIMFKILPLIIFFSKPSISASFNERRNVRSSVFPDDETEQRPVFIPKLTSSSCWKEGNFCEDVEGYPDTYVDAELSAEAEKHKYMFRIDEDGFATRKLEIEEFFCASKTQLKFPKVAMNTKNEWKYIYNSKNYKQGILVKYCRRVGIPCISHQAIFRTTCKQKYASRSMLTISYNGSLEVDSFNQPITCCCSLKPFIIWNSG